MVHQEELTDVNFRKISWINLLLTPPLLVLFAWPYFIFGSWFDLPGLLLYFGTFCFACSLTLNILHGHVTIAIGALHRSHYHDWLTRHRWSYGFFFKPFFFSTRFRLILILAAFAILAAGLFVTLLFK